MPIDFWVTFTCGYILGENGVLLVDIGVKLEADICSNRNMITFSGFVIWQYFTAFDLVKGKL